MGVVQKSYGRMDTSQNQLLTLLTTYMTTKVDFGQIGSKLAWPSKMHALYWMSESALKSI